MILWVAELSARAVGRESVFVATDDDRIENVVRGAGYSAIRTSGEARTGTDRLAEAARQIEADIYLNVQGDEPLLNPEDIKRVIAVKEKYPNEIVNCYCRLQAGEDPSSVNIPKVIFAEDGRLLYMSRSCIPGFKDSRNAPTVYHKQVCIYAFSASDLQKFAAFGRKSRLEQSEDIEILRFLEWGAQIRMVETSSGSLAVDIPEDVAPVEAALRSANRIAE